MHITIAGNLGSGKSTVCGILNSRYGFEIYSTGTVQRAYADERNISTYEMNLLMDEDPEFDKKIDETVTKISREKNNETIVFDSRMSWHFAENSFKIYLIIDPYVAATRVYNTRNTGVERYNSVEEALEGLSTRAKTENERFKKKYHVDNFDYRNYNLIVDTTYMTPDQIADIIYDNYKKYSEAPFDETLAVVSPKILYPTKSVSEADASDDAPISIARFDDYNYVFDGHKKLLNALKDNALFVCAKISDAATDTISSDSNILVNKLNALGVDALHAFEAAGSFSYSSYPKYY